MKGELVPHLVRHQSLKAPPTSHTVTLGKEGGGKEGRTNTTVNRQGIESMNVLNDWCLDHGISRNSEVRSWFKGASWDSLFALCEWGQKCSIHSAANSFHVATCQVISRWVEEFSWLKWGVVCAVRNNVFWWSNSGMAPWNCFHLVQWQAAQFVNFCTHFSSSVH